MRTEIESKELLARYGIDTTRPVLARDADEAVRLAGTMDGPLVMKVVSAEIIHKAAAGGVRLNVGPREVREAFGAIIDACRACSPAARIDGVLLERMVPPGFEVFIGARVDDAYGAVVLLGEGGSDVERGRAPAAALAPLHADLADDLLEAAFPGGAGLPGPQALARLKEYLLAVAGSDGLLLREDVGELDINPVIVSESAAVAVDAVVGPLGEARFSHRLDEPGLRDALARRRARLGGLDALFNPGSVAFVGASTSPGKLGYRNIKNLVDFGFRGRLYPIHPKAESICGVPAFPSVRDVPGTLDRVYVAVGATQVPDVLQDCASRGVKVVQVLSAGFSEWAGGEDTGGVELERRMREVLAESPTRMVGPNCIGTFSASGRLAMGAARFCPTEPGTITFISQSGTFAGDVVRRAQVLGIPVGQVLSCGNCADLDLVDYLLFCENDPASRLIALYVESLSDPGLFFRAAARIGKPIVVLKGGTTDQGMAAASSHTAALATDRTLWAAGLRQSGIVQVENLEELMDALLAYSAHTVLPGNRLGVFGSGGGVSVTSADTAARLGLTVPALEPATAAALQRFGVPGTSVANPIDIPVWGLRDGARFILGEIIDLLKRDSHVDSIIVYVEMGSIMDFADDDQAGLKELQAIAESVCEASRQGAPVTLALRSTGDRIQDDFVREQRCALLSRGIAVFPTTARAVRAHALLWRMTRGAGGN